MKTQLAPDAAVPALVVALLLCLAGCTGPDGPPGVGAAGPAGSQGATGSNGPAGPAGKTGAMGAGLEGGVATSCLSPCHGFNGVVAQFKTSVHYSAYTTYLGTDIAGEWTAAGASCGNCHAIDALSRRAAGVVGTNGGATVQNLAGGVLEYRLDGGAATESTYTGTADSAEVYCTTCHAVTDANDPHKTGIPWTRGSFPQVAGTTPTDLAFIEKSPTNTSSTGTSIGALGSANTCISCHKSRKDVTAYITASNVLTSTHWGPHEGPQADVFSGKGGYQYAGLAYGTSTHQQKLNCVDCHMPDIAANSGVADHSFNPRLRACQSCHAGSTNFDMGGGQSQVRLAMAELQVALSNAGYLTRSASAPYAALQPAELSDNAFALDQARPGGPPLTASQAGALYNYILVARGGGLGVHNPKYVKQLIFDAYVAVVGTPPLTIARPL